MIAEGQGSPFEYSAPAMAPVVWFMIQPLKLPKLAEKGAIGVALALKLADEEGEALALGVALNERLPEGLAVELAEKPGDTVALGDAVAEDAAPDPGTPLTIAVTEPSSETESA